MIFIKHAKQIAKTSFYENENNLSFLQFSFFKDLDIFDANMKSTVFIPSFLRANQVFKPWNAILWKRILTLLNLFYDLTAMNTAPVLLLMEKYKKKFKFIILICVLCLYDSFKWALFIINTIMFISTFKDAKMLRCFNTALRRNIVWTNIRSLLHVFTYTFFIEKSQCCSHKMRNAFHIIVIVLW